MKRIQKQLCGKMRCSTDTKSTIHKKEEYSKYTALANTYSNNNKPI